MIRAGIPYRLLLGQEDIAFVPVSAFPQSLIPALGHRCVNLSARATRTGFRGLVGM